MTAAGAQEMLDKLKPLVADAAVRSIIITGGLPGIFIRHYDVGELSTASDASKDAPPLDPAWDGKAPGGFLALVDLIHEAPKPVVAGDQRSLHGRRLRAQPGLRPAHRQPRRRGHRPAGDPGRHLPGRRRHAAAAARGRRGQGAGDHPAWPDVQLGRSAAHRRGARDRRRSGGPRAGDGGGVGSARRGGHRLRQAAHPRRFGPPPWARGWPTSAGPSRR